jgi:hypothetical protein
MFIMFLSRNDGGLAAPEVLLYDGSILIGHCTRRKSPLITSSTSLSSFPTSKPAERYSRHLHGCDRISIEFCVDLGVLSADHRRSVDRTTAGTYTSVPRFGIAAHVIDITLHRDYIMSATNKDTD